MISANSERDQPVQRDILAEHVHGDRQVVHGVELAAEQHQHPTLQDEQQAEGREDRIHLEHGAVLRALHQRHQHDFVEQPIDREADRDHDQQPDQRTDGEGGKTPQPAERSRDQALAVGQVHDACDAVLEREPHGDERIHAAQHGAGQHDIDRKRHDALQIPGAMARA